MHSSAGVYTVASNSIGAGLHVYMQAAPAELNIAIAAMSLTSCLCCRPGKLLRFDIGPGGLQIQHGQPLGADLKFTGVANQRRGRADVYSKVLSYMTYMIVF